MLKTRWIKTVYLLMGVICLALAKGDWPMVLAGVGFPYFLLRYTRSYRGIGELLLLVVAMVLGVYLGLSKRMAFFPLPFYLVSVVMATFQVLIPLLAERFYSRRVKGFTQCLVYPCLLTSCEFLNSFSGGNWSVLGFSPVDSPLLMQAAAWFGLYFITFGTAFLGAFLNWVQDQRWEWQVIRKPVVVVLGTLSIWMMVGNGELKQDNFHPVTRMAGIFRQESGAGADFTRVDYAYWRQRRSSKEKIAKAIQNTRQAIAAGARIVTWAEAYLLLDEQQQASVLKELQQLASQDQVCILASYLMLKDPKRAGRRMENKAVLIDSRGRVAFSYRKSYLVNGIEDRIVEPGDRMIRAVDTPYGRIGTVICYDMMFPQMTRQASAKQLDLLLVPGYDWRGIAPLATQISEVSALENRTPFLRVTTNGFSAAYDAYGRCLGQLNAYNTDQEIFFCDIPIQRRFSLYGAGGWLFPYVILGLTGLLLVWGLLSRSSGLAWMRSREGAGEVS